MAMADSGCEIAILLNKVLFVELHKIRTKIITAKTGCFIVSEERGIAAIPVLDTEGRRRILEVPALLAPECDMPLLSIASFVNQNKKVIFALDTSGICVDETIFIPFH